MRSVVLRRRKESLGCRLIGDHPLTLDWSSYASVYDRVLCKTTTYRALIADLLGRTGPLPPLRDATVILDCGCGTGNLCLSLSGQLPAATLVAVDNDATMAQYFRRKLADRLSAVPRSGGVCFIEADLMAIFPWLTKHNLQPDYVFLVNVLYLLDDPATTLLDSGFRRITYLTHDHYAGQSLLLSARI